MKKYIIPAFAMLTLSALPATAQDGSFYGTVGYSNISADDVNLGAVTVRGGYDFTENFGAEIEGSFGIVDEDVNVLGTSVNVELDQAIGIYGVGKLPVGENTDLFARVGYVNTEISASAAGVSAAGDESAAAFGVGGEFSFANGHGVRAGYTYHDLGDGTDVFDVAYVVRF